MYILRVRDKCVCLLSSSAIIMVAVGWVTITRLKTSIAVSNTFSVSLSSKAMSFIIATAVTQRGVSNGGSMVKTLFCTS